VVEKGISGGSGEHAFPGKGRMKPEDAEVYQLKRQVPTWKKRGRS
jgi:hypothetical protein